MTGSRDAVLRVSMGSPRDDILPRLLNTGWVACGRSGGFFGAWDAAHRVSIASTSVAIICRLLNASWVACGRNDRWDISAARVVGDEIGDGRDGGGWDGEELAFVNIIDEAEEEALAAGLGNALGHAEGGSFCEWTS